MPAQPLTHHQILALAAPFTRRGRHVDLAASDRLQRRLVFRPTCPAPGMQETLQLEPAAADRPADRPADPADQQDRAHRTHQAGLSPQTGQPGQTRLTRLLDAASGLQARLAASGAESASLLVAVDAVAPQRQFSAGDGFVLAFSHHLDCAAAGDPALILVAAQARLGAGGMELALDVPADRRVPATLTLQAAADRLPLALPEDLLAVLGWSWSRLSPLHGGAGGWRCNLRLRGRGPARGRDAEAKLQRTAAHLVQTLAEPPARFHERHLAGRWKMSLRRAIPLLACLALFAAAVIVPQLALGHESVMRMLVFNAPPLLLGLFFGLRELPRFEIPPLPRRPRAGSWQQVPDTQTER